MRAALLALALALSTLCTGTRAHAQLDVARALRGTPLGTQLSVREDEGAALQLADVVASPQAFRSVASDTPSFGHSDSAYWFRFSIRNSGASARTWLLELAYPHIDQVTLYVPDASGDYHPRFAGDARPFDQRDLAYRNVVFMLEEPPRGRRTYYLRVASVGSLTVPLVAWSAREFIEHQHLDWAGLCLFYGVILVMTFYSVSLYVQTRERSYVVFALTVLGMGLFELSYVGHTFQLLFPGQPRVAQRLLPSSVALCIFASTLLKRYYLPESELPGWYRRTFGVMLVYTGAVVLVTLVAPYRASVQLLFVSAVLLLVVALPSCVRLVLLGVQGSLVFFLAWTSFWAGALVSLSVATGALTRSPLSEWSAQLGMALQLVLLSSGLASKLNRMRAELGTLNGVLSQKVEALEDALVRAEEATQQAETATRVKDEFMATMSHELRTPLNTIINLPQGLVEDFPITRYAQCAQCASHFELEPDESADARTPCPECASVGTLRFRELARYAGRPERTAHYLHKIERSGTHLLRVMNAILDEGKTEEGQFKLLRERFELVPFVRDVLDEMADIAERAGVALSLAPGPKRLPVFADPLRMRQVLINLLANAIKFSNGRGTVTVSVGARIDSCVVAVRDEGIGIAKDKIDRVFGNFEQVHRSDQRAFGGTGLGLSISRSLVRRHGGDMWLQTELGRGSIFFFSIPHGITRTRELPVRDAV